MKKILLASLLCAMTAPAAFAASTTEVTVTGTITPAACTPVLSAGGSFDFGKISAGDLGQLGTSFLSDPQTLSVNCSAPARFALRAIDARAGSSTGLVDISFGLGMNGTKKIGNYMLRLPADRMVVDGNSSVARLRTINDGAAWQVESSAFSVLHNGAYAGRYHSFGPAGVTEPAAISTLTADMVVFMRIAPPNQLDLTDDINIDGASTLEVSYL